MCVLFFVVFFFWGGGGVKTCMPHLLFKKWLEKYLLNFSLTLYVGQYDILCHFVSPCELLRWIFFNQNMAAQSVTCLTTDLYLTENPGVASLIPALPHTFVEIDHVIISTVILLPSADSFKKGCCQLQAKVCAQRAG